MPNVSGLLYDGGSGEVRNVRCEDRRGAQSLSVFCQRLVKDIRDIFSYVIDIPYSTRTILEGPI